MNLMLWKDDVKAEDTPTIQTAKPGLGYSVLRAIELARALWRLWRLGRLHVRREAEDYGDGLNIQLQWPDGVWLCVWHDRKKDGNVFMQISQRGNHDVTKVEWRVSAGHRASGTVTVKQGPQA